MIEDEMVGWCHQINGHEFEQTPGDTEGQGYLACCSPWGCKESDTTEGLNNNNNNYPHALCTPTALPFQFVKCLIVFPISPHLHHTDST